MLLAKTNLNTLEVLIDSYADHDEFFSQNNLLREYNEIKEKSKTLKILWNILYKNNGNLFCQL